MPTGIPRHRSLLALGLAVVLVMAAAACEHTTSIRHVATTTAHTTGSTLTVPRPAGTAAGDVLVARVANRNDITATVTAPAGWVQHRVDQTTWSVKSWIFVKVATGDEPTSYPFTFNRSLNVIGSVSAFRGVDTAQPVEDAAGRYNGSTATLTPGRGLTTRTGNGATVWFATQAADEATCASPLGAPSGFIEVVETCLPSSTKGLSYDVATAAFGAAGTHPVPVGQSAVAATNITQTIALRAADAPPVDDYAPTPVVVGRLWDGYVNGVKDTAIPLSVLDQPSGLGASRTNPGVLYVHSEKEHQTMVAVSAVDGEVRGRYSVTIPNVFDWEDIAVGPCPSGSCIFAGDVGTYRGDTTKPTNVMSIVRVPEPDLAAGETGGTLTGDHFPFVYPDGRKKDSEAIMVDPRTRDIYVITKTATGISEVYRFPTPDPTPGQTVTLTKVGELHLPLLDGDENSVRITAASIHPTRNVFAVRTYRAVYEFRGTAGGSLASALTADPVAVTDTQEGQGESLEYAVDGSSYFTLSERASPPYTLKRVDRL